MFSGQNKQGKGLNVFARNITILLVVPFVAVPLGLTLSVQSTSRIPHTGEQGIKNSVPTYKTAAQVAPKPSYIGVDSTHGINDLKNIYSFINLYRSRNQGDYPAGIPDLLKLMFSLPEYKGREGFNKASELFTNPDTRHAEDPIYSEAPDKQFVYSITNLRPNGDKIGGSKTAGTRDLLALTDIYYHRNYRISEKRQKAPNPIGFYLVLWDDGTVETVPYDQVLKQQSSHGNGYIDVFPGQAGVSTELITYEEQWTQTGHLLDFPPLGKPILKGKSEPAPDNGGPESLVTFSRTLGFPSRYGIERETVWNSFDLEREEFSLTDVQEVAARLNLALEIKRLSIDEIAKLNAPAIFMTGDDKRIVALTNVDDKEAIIVDL